VQAEIWLTVPLLPVELGAEEGRLVLGVGHVGSGPAVGAYQREYATAAGLQPDLDPGTTLVVTDWHYAGRGDPPIDLPPSMGGAPCPGS
jgi:hypothetical protein